MLLSSSQRLLQNFTHRKLPCSSNLCRREAAGRLDFTNADDEGDVLLELNDEVRTGLLESITAAEVLAATEGMELDDLADLVADLPQDITDEVINSLSIRDRQRP